MRRFNHYELHNADTRKIPAKDEELEHDPKSMHNVFDTRHRKSSSTSSSLSLDDRMHESHLPSSPLSQPRPTDPSPPSFSIGNSATAEFVRALYDYDADDRNALSFRAGDTIKVIKQVGRGWWDGEINGVRGWFPSSHCIQVPHLTKDWTEDGIAGYIADRDTASSGESETTISDAKSINDHNTCTPPVEGTGTKEQEEAAFWIPQATSDTSDGRLFHFITSRWTRTMESPLITSRNETATSTDVVDPPALAPESNSKNDDQQQALVEMPGVEGLLLVRGDRQASTKSAVDKWDCAICRQSASTADCPALTRCAHPAQICTQCYQKSIETQLAERPFNEIKCPESTCKEIIGHAELRAYTSIGTYLRFNELWARNRARSEPCFLWCPGENCGAGHIHDAKVSGNKFVCISCHYAFCSQHHVVWVEGGTCTHTHGRRSDGKPLLEMCWASKNHEKEVVRAASLALSTSRVSADESRAIFAARFGWTQDHHTLGRTDRDPLLVCSPLGHGALGIVEEVKRANSEYDSLVRKRVLLPYQRRQQRLKIIQEEAKALVDLSHVHIVQIVGSYEDHISPQRQFYCLLMAPVGDSDLKTFLDMLGASYRYASLQVMWLRKWFGCLTSALAYVHSQGIRHQDIKPSNIIHRGSNVYFTDFSSSSRFQVGWTTSTEDPGRTSFIDAPPEVVNRFREDGELNRHGRGSDVFSLGCVFSEMLTVFGGRSVEDLHQFLFKKPHIYGGVDIQEEDDPTRGRSMTYGRTIQRASLWWQNSFETEIFEECIKPMLHYNRQSRPEATRCLEAFRKRMPSWCADCPCQKDGIVRTTSIKEPITTNHGGTAVKRNSPDSSVKEVPSFSRLLTSKRQESEVRLRTPPSPIDVEQRRASPIDISERSDSNALHRTLLPVSNDKPTLSAESSKSRFNRSFMRRKMNTTPSKPTLALASEDNIDHPAVASKANSSRAKKWRPQLTKSPFSSPLQTPSNPPPHLDYEMPSQMKLRVNITSSRSSATNVVSSVILVVSTNISFEFLVDRIEAKLQRSTNISLKAGHAKLKYMDDDDYVSIQSDEDVEMAFETCTEQQRDSSRVANLSDLARGPSTVLPEVVLYCIQSLYSPGNIKC